MSLLKRIRGVPRPPLVDVIAFIGLVCVTLGVAMVFIPAAFVVFGALLLKYAIAASRSEVISDTEEPA